MNLVVANQFRISKFSESQLRRPSEIEISKLMENYNLFGEAAKRV